MKVIFHIDVNSAFLSWSAIDLLKENPKGVDIRKIDAIIGGDDGTRRGVVVSKSKSAKLLDIKVGESILKVKSKYPNLLIVEPNMQSYRKHSSEFMNLLLSYTDKVEQVSIDEAYVDVTDLIDKSQVESIFNLAYEIKDKIRDGLGFTVNIGISVNKFLAKMASDFEKPDRVHTLFKSEIKDKMYKLPIDNLYGCGKATTKRLNEVGIATIGDAADTSLERLQALLGVKLGYYIYQSAHGNGDDEVAVNTSERKSYSMEVTTINDIELSDIRSSTLLLSQISESLAERLKEDNKSVYTVAITIKDSDFKKHSKQVSLKKSIRDKGDILRESEKLYKSLVKELEKFKGIRLLGIRLSNIDNNEYHQMTIEEYLESLSNHEY